MKRFIVLMMLILGAPGLSFAISHSQLTDSNAGRGLHFKGFTSPSYSALQAVTTQLCGDTGSVTGNGPIQDYIFDCNDNQWHPYQIGPASTSTWTPTPTWTVTNTPSPTVTSTPTNTPTKTNTLPAGTNTPTLVPTFTPTFTPTITNTPTSTVTAISTVTPVIGSDVDLVGNEVYNTATGVTIVGNRIQVTGISGVNSGDYVSFTGLLPTAANVLWPVVNSSSSYFEVQTNMPSITNGGSADCIFLIRGNRSKNANLFKSILRSGLALYDFTFVNPQPDSNYQIITGAAGGSGGSNLFMAVPTITTTDFTAYTVFSTAMTGREPSAYFAIHLKGIQ